MPMIGNTGSGIGRGESNKAKIARRVIEVLEFFDEAHPRATVMDIVRRFNRPQSSTSELLSSLVDLGLLYKDPYSRSYTPTPRAAMLGASVQPDLVRDGRLTGLIDRLTSQTGLAVALFGMVGLNVQIFNWRPGTRPMRTAGAGFSANEFSGGQLERLSDSAVGWLLLSTIDQSRRDGTIRRLNAEAAPERKFVPAALSAQVQQCRETGHVTGAAGFGSIADICAVLLPDQPAGQPLALGFVYEPSEQIMPDALRQTLLDAISRNAEPAMPVVAPMIAEAQPLFCAA
jgi:DNA-binding IclR family transcriptional regulator